MFKRKKKRLREVEFDLLNTMKEQMGFTWKEMGELMGVSSVQICNYRNSGRVPADRYWGARDALLLAVEEKAREERERIIKLFSS